MHQQQSQRPASRSGDQIGVTAHHHYIGAICLQQSARKPDISDTGSAGKRLPYSSRYVIVGRGGAGRGGGSGSWKQQHAQDRMSHSQPDCERAPPFIDT